MAADNQYITRTIDSALRQWAQSTPRKVLLLRGARQVGKSSAVRELGRNFDSFVEVNFDQNPNLSKLFEQSLSPQQICQQLSILYQTPIVAGRTLLFFDEIQSSASAMASLRYFYEQYPELHVVAAGSLLEFALEQMPSYGVGRMRNIFMYPFSFEEFLRSLGQTMLVEAYTTASPDKPLTDIVHQKLIEQLRIFITIGGMPEVVATYARSGDLLSCQTILTDLVVSFNQDFAKYKKRVPPARIAEVFASVAAQSSGKFVYERAASGISSERVKQALELLIMAGLVYPVTHTAANGIPLAAERNEKYQRMMLCDIGLYQRVMRLDLSQILISDDLRLVNRGVIAEMFVGQEIIKSMSCYEPAELYCWVRDKRQGNAQVDYVVQRGEQIVPIEVKSGSRGAMQSLREFLSDKRIDRGVRTSTENFGRYDNIEVYPLYAIGNLLR